MMKTNDLGYIHYLEVTAAVGVQHSESFCIQLFGEAMEKEIKVK